MQYAPENHWHPHDCPYRIVIRPLSQITKKQKKKLDEEFPGGIDEETFYYIKPPSSPPYKVPPKVRVYLGEEVARTMRQMALQYEYEYQEVVEIMLFITMKQTAILRNDDPMGHAQANALIYTFTKEKVDICTFLMETWGRERGFIK